MKAAFPKMKIWLSALLAFALVGGIGARTTSASDEYDAMREKWQAMLTGGVLDTSDGDIAGAIGRLDEEAGCYWTSMDKSPTRTYLWSDIFKVGNSIHIRQSYERLRTMALAYATEGSAYYHDATLAGDLVSALDYMYDTRYNESVVTTPSGTSNWWDWQIGIPMPLNDAVALLYDQLSAEQIANYMNAVNRFSPEVGLTGANRAWKAIVVGVAGVIGKDGAKLADARDGLSPIFDYVTTKDGFYADGSFVQHSVFAYTGGYGISLVQTVADLMALLHGSSWEVTDPDQAHVWQWVYDAYRPLIYKGAMMDMVRGREISRDYSQDHLAGHEAIQGILRLIDAAPAADAAAFKSMVKGWIQADTFLDFLAAAPVPFVAQAKAIVSDPLVAPASELSLYKQYAGMDRAVQLRPGYGFGIAMYSNRISSYESINSENAKAWYTGAGATALYNGDLGQYSGGYWPTVDSYRLPGTTVLSQTPEPSHLSANNWTGGTDLFGTYGVSGMDLQYGSHTLGAKKSWFLFDDEIVALGAGITSTDGIPVETIAENRKLNETGSNAFEVNGTAAVSAFGTSPQTLTGVQWAHLAGSAPGSDIGYYFPESPTLQAKREARTGNWKQINSRPETPSTSITNRYLTLWFDHGANPANAGYEYALLPNKSSAETAAYAANPNFEVLENSAQAQAVKEKTLGVIGANFWENASHTVDLITVDKKASVMTKEVADTSLDVSVSDPTQANAGTIAIELNRSAASYTADPGVTVTQLSPTIRFTVNVNGAHGKAFHASFALGTPSGNPGDPGDPGDPEPTPVIVDNADASGVTKTGTWKTASTQTDRYGPNYLHDDNTGKGSKTVTFTPNLPVAGDYEVYMMWPEHFNRATNIPVSVAYDGGTDTVTVNETTYGGTWNLLGTFSFAAGSGGSVTISNAGTNGYVVADAVKFLPLPPPPEPVIVDNADAAGVTKTGTWKTASTQTDRYGPNYVHDDNTGKGSKTVTFTPDLPVAGTYNVYLMWPAHFNRATNIPVSVAYDGGTDTVTVDETANGGTWNLLGAYTFEAGGGSVTISNAGTNGYVVADAVKFEFVP